MAKKLKPVPTTVVNGKLVLQLYVAGMTAKSMEAIENIKKLCDENLQEAFELQIVDIYKNPETDSQQQQIVFSPSLVKRMPLPQKIMIGDFSDPDKVIRGLGINFKE